MVEDEEWENEGRRRQGGEGEKRKQARGAAVYEEAPHFTRAGR